MFKITRNLDPKPSDIATARSYSTLEGAFADMADGVVWRDGEVVAFHERHLWLLEARAARV